MRHKFVDFFTRNLPLKLISLVIAFIIWMLVTNSNDPIDTRLYSNIQITLVNEDSVADIGKVVEPEGTGTVTVKVTERKSILNQLSRTGNDFYVEADLNNLNDMNAIPLTVTCTNPAVTWDEMELSPTALKVTLENKVEQAFPVNVSVSGEVAQATGCTVGSTSVTEGKNILIAGPESLINIIGQVTAPVSVSSVKDDTTLSSVVRITDKNGDAFTESQMSRLELKDSEGNLLSDRTVRVAIDLWKIRSDVPLRVKTTGTPAPGYFVSDVETIPKTITIAGTDEALEQVGDKLDVIDSVNVNGASRDISEEIDLTDTLSGYSSLKLVNEDDPTVSVEITIEKSGDRTFELPVGNIELLNKPDDMKLVFTPADLLDVSVHSDDYDFSDFSVTDIKASVDLTPCETEGNYELPVELEVPEGYEVNDEVTITVNSSVISETDTSGAVIRKQRTGDEEQSTE